MDFIQQNDQLMKFLIHKYTLILLLITMVVFSVHSCNKQSKEIQRLRANYHTVNLNAITPRIVEVVSKREARLVKAALDSLEFAYKTKIKHLQSLQQVKYEIVEKPVFIPFPFPIHDTIFTPYEFTHSVYCQNFKFSTNTENQQGFDFTWSGNIDINIVNEIARQDTFKIFKIPIFRYGQRIVRNQVTSHCIPDELLTYNRIFQIKNK